MHFAPEHCRSERLIRAYSDGQVIIGEQAYRQSLLVSETVLIKDWRPQGVGELVHSDFDYLLENKPEIFLLGTGSRLQFPSPAVTGRLLQAGIGVEIMDTAAACRTFNILLTEQRAVVAGLLLR